MDLSRFNLFARQATPSLYSIAEQVRHEEYGLGVCISNEDFEGFVKVKLDIGPTVLAHRALLHHGTFSKDWKDAA